MADEEKRGCIIAISRQFGSGGRTVGEEVAKRLSIPCYDGELVDQVAEKSGFAKDYVEEMGENVAKGFWVSRTLSAAGGSGHLSNQDIIWIAQREAILKIAAEGPCVIVGRCADCILKGMYPLLTVFIHAPVDKRIERIVNNYGETDEMPEKRLRDKDKRRATYYKFYTDVDWGKAENYDLCLDSSRFGIDGCVDVIEKLYRERS